MDLNQAYLFKSLMGFNDFGVKIAFYRGYIERYKAPLDQMISIAMTEA